MVFNNYVNRIAGEPAEVGVEKKKKKKKPNTFIPEHLSKFNAGNELCWFWVFLVFMSVARNL